MGSSGGASARTVKVKGNRRKFPEAYKRLRAPGDRLSWLAGEECQKALEARQLHKDQVDAETRRLTEAAADVQAVAPSTTQLEDWYRGEAFPPTADDPANAVRRARHVLNPVERPHLWPAVYLTQDGATYDVVVADDMRRRRDLEMGGVPSATAKAMRALADRRGVLVESVHPDDAAEDQKQLEAYRKAVGAEEFARIEVAFR